MDSVEDQNDLSRAQYVQWRRTVREAFTASFGPPGSRTPFGAVMFEYIEKETRGSREKIAIDNNGRTDVEQTFYRMGQRDILSLIHSAIEWREP